MIRKLGTLTVALMLASASWEATAVGFGTLPSSAVLGQPLQLAIPLRLEPGETLGPECLAGEVHFADTRQQPGTTTLRLDPALPAASERLLRLSTTTRVDEPIVTVEVTVGCAAKVTRRFTLFADPPLVAPPEPAVAAAEPAPAPMPPAAASAPAPAPRAAAESGNPAGAEPAPPRRPPQRAVQPAATQPSTAARTVPRRPAVARAAPSGAPRLSLSPLEPGALVAQAKPPSAADVAASAAAAEQAASAAAAASAASAAADAAIEESRKRVAELEAAVAKLRSDTAASQKTIEGLQTRLLRAEDVRFDNPVVYGLVALLLLLAGALLWMWRQLRQEREAHAWLAQATAASSAGTATARGHAEPIAADPQPAAPPVPVPTLNAWVSKPSPIDGFDETRAVTRADAHTLGAPITGPGALTQPESKREVSVEELIDLEQQAEFFVVLGQDAAAIDLLMGHVRSTAASPLPYLKLLEIYKRLGERAEYERMRERFNSRFNAYAPAWETDLQAGRSLEDYQHVMGRLTSLWSTPRQALKVLEATLLRAEGAEADTGGAHAFELPAYRELLMLYSVARDLAEDDTGAVDLLLPLEDAPDSGPDSLYGGVYERLLATTSLAAQPQAQKPLAVDLQLDDIGEPPLEGGITLDLPPIVDPKAPR